MPTKCSRLVSSVLATAIFCSCHPVLKSLNSDKLSREAAQHFTTIALDSVDIPKLEPFRYESDSYAYLYTMKASFKGQKLKGSIEQKTFRKDLPDLPVEGIKPQLLRFSLDFKICCSNHTPRHCVKSKVEAEDSTRTRGCTDWKLIILN